MSLFCTCTLQFQNHTCTFSNKTPKITSLLFISHTDVASFQIVGEREFIYQILVRNKPLLATSHLRIQCIGKHWHESCEKARRLRCLFKTRTLDITVGCTVPNRASMTCRCVCVFEGHSPAQWDEIQCVNGSLFLSSPLGLQLMSEGQDVSGCSLWLLIWCQCCALSHNGNGLVRASDYV